MREEARTYWLLNVPEDADKQLLRGLQIESMMPNSTEGGKGEYADRCDAERLRVTFSLPHRSACSKQRLERRKHGSWTGGISMVPWASYALNGRKWTPFENDPSFWNRFSHMPRMSSGPDFR